jgi:hypothetical protein
MDKSMTSILDGVEEIIDTALGCRSGTRSGYLALDTTDLDGVGLVAALYAQIGRNLNGRAVERLASRENWRWLKQTAQSDGNRSREKRLEKAIVRLATDDWVNQVPTASGVMGSGERHRNIDLIHQLGLDQYEFIELKVDADSPLYAAREILGYGLIYLLSREHRTTLGYSPHLALLRAQRIELKVLAPLSFYADHGRREELDRLQTKIQTGLQVLLAGRGEPLGLAMSFWFEAFPDACRWETPSETQELLQRRFRLC